MVDQDHGLIRSALRKRSLFLLAFLTFLLHAAEPFNDVDTAVAEILAKTGSNANAYFSEEAIRDFAGTLRPLGTPKEFTQASQSLRGGMIARRYRVVTPKKTLRISTFWMPDGKLEQYIVTAE